MAENKESLSQLNKDFIKWSGFNLEGSNSEELLECLKGRHWDLECELKQQADVFRERILNLTNNEMR